MPHDIAPTEDVNLRFGIRKNIGAAGRHARMFATGLLRGQTAVRQRQFQHVYKASLWGGAGDTGFFSGIGSRGSTADEYADNMAHILRRHTDERGRRLTVLDLGCGDFEIGRRLIQRLPDMIYIGADIVPELVAYNQKQFSSEFASFHRIDIVSDALPVADVCLVREVFQHLSNDEIRRTLPKLSHDFVYVTEAQPQILEGKPNPDKPAGATIRFDWQTGRGRGVELDQPPFNRRTVEVFRTGSITAQEIVTLRLFHD